MTAAEDGVVIGKIVKPHGLKGEVVVEPLTDFPGRFFEGLRVRLSGAAAAARDACIAAVRPHQGRLLITFEGITDASAAQALRNADMSVPLASVAVRPPGFVYHWEIEGALAVDAGGRELGRVTDLIDVAGRPLLVLETPRGPREVPFTQPIVVSVDAAAKRVVLDPPEGLLD